MKFIKMSGLAIVMFMFSGQGLWAAPTLTTKINSKAAIEKISTDLKRNLSQLSPEAKKTSYKYLTKVSRSNGHSLAERWRATVTLSRFYPKSGATTRSLQSRTWFLRNAALLGLAESKPKLAIEWASKFIAGDRSLVVRTAAVDVLKKWPSKKVRGILRQNIDNKRNFKNGEPLWIRKNILKALYSMSTKKDLPGIMSELKNNPDQQHVQYLLKALPRISGQSINTSPFDSERKAWLNWWEINKNQLINR